MIHVIDTVLLPPAEEPMSNIVEIAVADGRFTTLVAALQAAGLDETLAGEGSFTVLPQQMMPLPNFLKVLWKLFLRTSLP